MFDTVTIEKPLAQSGKPAKNTFFQKNLRRAAQALLGCLAMVALLTGSAAAATAPTVTSVSATTGPTVGGISVTITGTTFSGVTGVSFGSTAASSYLINSATQITAVSPAGSAGAVDVTVTTAGGTSATSSADKYTYAATPAFRVTTLVDDATGTASYCNDISGGATPDTSCNLRDAIAAAAAVETSTVTPNIDFASTLATSTGSVTLSTATPGDYLTTTGGVLSISSNVNIMGSGANLLSIDGGTKNQVFSIASGTVSISGLTITKGSITASGEDYGGGIYNAGTLTVSNCAFVGNLSYGGGGGIANYDGTLTVIGSTFSGNTSSSWGGGIMSVAAIGNTASLTVLNSTIVNNLSSYGAGIYDESQYATLYNNTISGNAVVAGSSSSGGLNLYGSQSYSTANYKFGNNLINGNIYSGNSYTDEGGNVTSGTVNLAALGYYGGTTETMPLIPGSVGFCAGTAANATAYGLTTDQRGSARSTTAYSTTPCVDAGAVQSAYSLVFTTSPSTTQTAGVVLTSSPVVQLEDYSATTGAAAAIDLSGVAISVAPYSGTFSSGTTSVSTGSTGLSTYSNLIISTTETDDYLIASATVGSYTIQGESSDFNVDLLSQTISFTDSLPSTALYDGVSLTYTISATGGASGNAVTFSIDSSSTASASLSSGTLTISGAGTVIIDADQAGNATYQAGAASQEIAVSLDTPASITVVSGSGQTGYVGAAFASPLVAQVKGTSGSIMVSETVNFTAPTTGASATLSSSSSSTDSTGDVSVTPTANATVGGPYNVTATISGTSISTTFSLTNKLVPIYTVTTLTDDATGTASKCNDVSGGATANSGCSLRDAIAAVTALSTTATPTINFSSALTATATTANPADYKITTGGTLSIGANMDIVGPGANMLKIDGGGSDQVFNITAGTVAISMLTITNGLASSSGGGIYNNGTLAISYCSISSNSSGSVGGGISNASSGVLTLTGSTVANNASQGYGAGFFNNGAATVINSTFTGNSATTVNGYGGAISPYSGSMTIINTTISGNSASEGGAGIYGNKYVLYNSVDTDSFYGGPSASSNNVLTGTTLGTLGNYGGATQTMVPLPGSSAICAGSLSYLAPAYTGLSAVLAIDQRGNLRTHTYGSTTCVDAGAVQTGYQLAFESSPSSPQKSGVAFTSGSTVQLFDNGTKFALAGAPITIALNSGTLSGTTSQNTDATGLATFTGVSSTTTTTLSNDYLIASAPVGAYTIKTDSSVFNIIALILPGGALSSGTVDTSYSTTITATGGTGTISYALTSGSSLPAGLTLNSSTGVISGYPTVASGTAYSFSITATDGGGDTASGTYTLTINPTASTVAVLLSSGANPSFTSNAVSFTATVGPSSSVSASGMAYPTGTVTFYDNGTALTSCTAVTLGSYSTATGTATATCTLNSLAAPLSVASHSITASYSGDGNFDALLASSSSGYSETVMSFTVVTTGAATVTVIPGSSTQYTFTVTPTGGNTFPTAITLSLTGLPSNYSYSFSPSATIAAGASATTVTLNIQTVAGTVSTTAAKTNGAAMKLAPFTLALLLLPFAGRMRKSGKRFSRLLTVLLLMGAGALVMAGMSGCNNNTGFFAQAEKSYTAIQVTATSGALSQTSNDITLTVE